MRNNIKKRQVDCPKLESFIPIIKERLETGASVIFSPHGVSMLPLIRQGKDNVELSPLPKIINRYDIILYQRRNGKYVLHRVVRIEGDQLLMMGDNQFVIERGITRENALALVTAVYRKNTRIKTSNLIYRIYSILWYKMRMVIMLFKRKSKFLKGL